MIFLIKFVKSTNFLKSLTLISRLIFVSDIVLDIETNFTSSEIPFILSTKAFISLSLIFSLIIKAKLITSR